MTLYADGFQSTFAPYLVGTWLVDGVLVRRDQPWRPPDSGQIALADGAGALSLVVNEIDGDYALAEGIVTIDSRRDELLVWNEYLASVPSELARQARRAFAEIARSVPTTPAPVTRVDDEDGEIQLEWRSGSSYLQLALRGDGSATWFFRDTAANTFDGNLDPQETIPPEFLARLGAMH